MPPPNDKALTHSPPVLTFPVSQISRSESGYPSGRSSTVFATVKTAVFMPMASGSTITTVMANAGFLRIMRNPYRTS